MLITVFNENKVMDCRQCDIIKERGRERGGGGGRRGDNLKKYTARVTHQTARLPAQCTYTTDDPSPADQSPSSLKRRQDHEEDI